MVSALRQRAEKQLASAMAPRGEVEFTTPLREGRAGVGLPRRPNPGRAWQVWRRFGLAVSIAGAMGASAIGGVLMGRTGASSASVQAANAVATSAAAALPAPAESHAVMEASAPASTTPPHGHDVADPVQAAAPPSGAHDDASVSAATATAYADAAAPAEALAHAPTMAMAPAPAAPAPHEAAEPSSAHAAAAVALPSHAAVAVPAQGLVPVSVAPAPAPMAAPVKDITFGLDLNGDGIPDSLERFIRKTIASPATRVAARSYYRIALPLATRAEQGDLLAHADKQAVFRAAECYLVSAAEDGLADPPNLNDRASLIGIAAADRMQAMTEALQGFDYRVAANRRQACS